MATVVKISDVFFIRTISETANALLDALQSGQEEIVVDLANVEQIDSAALQVALSARKEAESRGVTLMFIPSDAVRNFASAIGITL